MQLTKTFQCYAGLLRFLSEYYLLTKGCTISIIDNSHFNRFEIMLFLGKSENQDGYEVRVYKYKKTDKYVPNPKDNIISFEENDEFITFFFKTFDLAKTFLMELPTKHPEYKNRPIRYI